MGSTAQPGHWRRISCSLAFVLLAALSSVVLVALVVRLMLVEYGLGCCGWMTFGLHAVGMTVAFGVCAPLGSLAFSLPFGSRPARKRLHIAGHSCAVLLAAVALATEWALHARKGGGHLHSSHSWTGLLTVVLYLAQWASGGLVFALPLAPPAF
mmetsp:Transcript_84261/g.251102  ORF Transcript_84261/g.251102 Transcript_84261/m.251102 type:complete len:154 (-) Transcript_84261:12-473(-)